MTMLALPRIAANAFENGSIVAERPPTKGIIDGCAAVPPVTPLHR
jgi:hypothetical protein